MKTLSIGVITTLAVLGSSSARADHPIELSAFAGWHLFSEKNGLGAHEGAAQPNIADGAGFGLRVSWGLLAGLHLEAELAFFPSEVEDSLIGEDPAMVVTWRLGAVYRFLQIDTRNPGTFFASAGIAEHAVEMSDRAQLIEEIDWSPYVGLGAAVRLGTTWGLRFDTKMFLVPSSQSNGRVPEFEVLGGVFRSFGAKPVAKAPPPPEPTPEPKPEPTPEPTPPPAPSPADADGDGIIDA